MFSQGRTMGPISNGSPSGTGTKTSAWGERTCPDFGIEFTDLSESTTDRCLMTEGRIEASCPRAA